MTIVGETVAPIIMGYCGYYGEYGDCLSHTAGMLWGDWRVCTFLSKSPNLMRDIRLGRENESMRRVRGIICGSRFPSAIP